MEFKEIYYPATFAATFVSEMRMEEDVRFKPSTRQAIAIVKLLSAIYFRKSNLIIEDYINAAVLTTFPEDQEIALEIARKILLLDKYDVVSAIKKKKTKKEDKKKKQVPTHSTRPQMKYTPLLARDKRKKTEILDELIIVFSEDRDKVEPFEFTEQLFEFMEKVNEGAISKLEPYHTMVKFFDNDTSQIILKNFTNEQEVIDYIKQKIHQNLGYLTPKDLQHIIGLDLYDYFSENLSISEKALAKALQGKNVYDEVSPLIHDNLHEAVEVIENLRKINFPLDDFREKFQKNIKKLNNLYEFSEINNILGPLSISKEEFRHLYDKSLNQFTSKELFENISKMDFEFGTNLTNDILEYYLDDLGNQPLDLSILPFINFYNEYLELKLKQTLENTLQNLINSEDPFHNLYNMSKNLLHFNEKIDYKAYKSQVKYKTLEAANKSLQFIENQQQFIDTVDRYLDEFKLKISHKFVWEHGRRLKIDDSEIAALLGGDFELLLMLIKECKGNFEGLLKLTKKVNPWYNRLDELTQAAIDANNKIGLAALANFNLKVIEYAKSQGKEDFALASLTAGSGTNVLYRWFSDNRYLSKDLREKIKKIVQTMLLRIALQYANKRFGNVEKGLRPVNSMRPLKDDDEFEYIDIEETINHIISQGKNPDLITSEDFIVNEIKHGKAAIVMLLDVSGSMSGEKLAICALTAVMLLYKFLKDELAISIFESNSYNIKNIDESVELDSIASDILELHSRGGTMIGASLDWTLEQFQKIESEDIMFIVFSDFAISDMNRTRATMEKLRKFKPYNYYMAPTEISYGYSEDGVETFKKFLPGHFIKLKDIKDIPDIVADIINKSFL